MIQENRERSPLTYITTTLLQINKYQLLKLIPMGVQQHPKELQTKTLQQGQETTHPGLYRHWIMY